MAAADLIGRNGGNEDARKGSVVVLTRVAKVARWVCERPSAFDCEQHAVAPLACGGALPFSATQVFTPRTPDHHVAPPPGVHGVHKFAAEHVCYARF